MAQSTTYSNEANDTMHDLRAKAGEKLNYAADHVESAVKTMAERGHEAGEKVQAVAGNFKTAVDTSVKDQPIATLAVAAALGFVLGALWKS